MANIPIDGNIQSLLSTKIGKSTSQKYLNFQIASYTSLRNVFINVHDRCIYAFYYVDSVYRLYKYNLFSGQSSLVWSRSTSGFGTIQDFLIDDNDKMYLSVYTNKYIWIIDLINNTETKWSYTTNMNPICYGKLEWIKYNEKFIMLDAGPNLLTFDIVNNEITSASMSPGYTSGDDYAVGQKYIFTTRTRYDFINGVGTTYTLPGGSNPTSVAYNNGKFYFALSSKLFTYDEATDTWSSQISVGWTNPIALSVSNGYCYAVNNGSNKGFMYDTNENKIHSYLLKWNIPTRAYNALTRGYIYNGIWMIARDTMCYMEYESNLKYNAGPILDHIRLFYNSSTKTSYDYDDRFVKFTDTYVTIQDGVLLYPDIERGLEIETISEDRNIYAISISKDDYNILKNIEVQ